MILGFADRATADLFAGRRSRLNRHADPVWDVARRKLGYLDSAAVLEDLRAPPGNRLEALKGKRAGQHSIRVNGQYRLCFVWTPRGPDAVAFVDYHDE